MEEQLSRLTEPAARKALEAELNHLKLAVEDTTAREQQARAREAEMAILAQNEQNRLTELNDRVNQMERALDEALRQLGGQ